MKMMKLVAGAAVVATLALAANAQAAAPLATVTVQATTPFGSWQDTGLDLSAGQTYNFTVIDPSTIWSAGSDVPFPRTSTADGIPPSGGYGVLTMDGFTANYGALVGEAGSHLFLIGAGPTVLSGLSGELTVGYWDSYYPDNSGVQTLSISAVPEPATWAMVIAGFGALGAALRSDRRKQAAVAAA